VGPEDGIPSVAAIKQAIYDHGPVSVAVCVGSAFQNYGGGVFKTNEYCSGDVNHAVVLVGWDDNQGTNGI
jgi:inhibitor of cysteine peptidase